MKRKIEMDFYKGSVVKPSEFHGRVGEINGLEIIFHYTAVPAWRRISHFIRDGDVFYMCFEAGDMCKISTSELEMLLEYKNVATNTNLSKPIVHELLLDIAKWFYAISLCVRSIFQKKG